MRGGGGPLDGNKGGGGYTGIVGGGERIPGSWNYRASLDRSGWVGMWRKN